MSPIEILITTLAVVCIFSALYVGFTFADMIHGDYLGQPKHPHRLFAAMVIMALSWVGMMVTAILKLMGILESLI